MERVRGCGTERGNAEVSHQRHLPRGITRCGRHDRSANPTRRFVEAQTSGEQPVSIGVLKDIVPGHSTGRKTARQNVGSEFQVGAGVAHYRRFTGRAAGGVNTHNLTLRS